MGKHVKTDPREQKHGQNVTLPTQARHRKFIPGDFVERIDGRTQGIVFMVRVSADEINESPDQYRLVSSALVDTDNGW